MATTASIPDQPQIPDRVNVTIPDEAKDMFAWLIRHDRVCEGRAATVAALLIKKGAAAMYAESLAQAEPLDGDVEEALTEHQRAALTQALGE